MGLKHLKKEKKMLNFTILLPILLFYILITGVIAFVKKANFYACICNIAFAIYICFLLKITFFPIPIQKEAILGLQNANQEYNFFPLHSICRIISENMDLPQILFLQICGNLFLLFPVGVYIPIIFKTCQSAKRMFITVLFLGIAIELMQHMLNMVIGFHYRNVDIDDVILNTLGGMIGYIVHRYVKPMYHSITQTKKSEKKMDLPF